MRNADYSDFDLATCRRPFVSASALAAYLGVDRRTIVRMIQHGSLDAIKVGRAYRVPTHAARAMFHVAQKQAS
jgi:excisionase family DNA binding protein